MKRNGSRLWHGMLAMVVLGVALVAVAPLRAALVQQGDNPLRGRQLYVNPNSNARRQADEWQRSRADDAELMRRMAAQPVATWMGDWNRDPRRDIDNTI
ncbi:MAG: hypothetical protein H0W68_08605, partial [Gemmatimonadaceae bacterium]|nr:hypothetical protein [Gemmatimonadaceae bacterium]